MSGAQLQAGCAIPAPPAVAGSAALPGGPWAIGLRELLWRLQRQHGRQRWWPAATAFEMAAGALLVQHTTWAGARQALSQLQEAGQLAPARLLQLPSARLEVLLRPAGTYRVKARRLRALASWWLAQADEAATLPTTTLRRRLLGVHGIGAETADCIALYGFGRALFVADAYARRLLARVGLCAPEVDYETLRHTVQGWLGEDVGLLNEAHALIVAHARVVCCARPRCAHCDLRARCATGIRLPAGGATLSP